MSTEALDRPATGPSERRGEVIKKIDRLVGTAGIWLLAATLFFLPLNTLRPFGGVAVADLLIAILVPVAVVIFLTRFVLTKKVGRFPRWLWGGALILVVSIALVELVPPASVERLAASFGVYGLSTESSLVVGTRLLFALVAFPVMISVIVDRWSTIDLMVSFWIAGVAISCLAAVFDSFFGFGIQSALAFDPDGIKGYLGVLSGDTARMVGLTDHPNTLSLTCLMASPLIMGRMKSRRGLIRYGPVLLLVILGVLLSGARAGVVGLALAAVFTLLMDERIRAAIRNLRKRTIATIVVALAVLLTLLAVGVLSSPDSTAGKLVPSSLSRIFRSEDVTRTNSDDERKTFVEDSITYIGERPLGGYGFEWVESSHITALQLLLAGGPFALIGFYLILIGYLIAGFRLGAKVPGGTRDVSIALTISLLLYAISGLVDNHVLSRYLYIPAGLILAMYLLQERGAAGEEDDPGDSIKPRPMALAVAGVAVVYAALVVAGPFEKHGSSAATLDPQKIPTGNLVKNPNLVNNSRYWDSFGNTADISRVRIKGINGKPRWALKTVTAGHRFPPGQTYFPEGHTVVAGVTPGVTYTGSLNVLAKPGTIYHLALQEVGGNGGGAAYATKIGTGKWQTPEVELTFGPRAAGAVLNLITTKKPQATTFFSYGARIAASRAQD